MGLPPMKHSDDPSRALGAALSLASNINSLGDGISARIGVATGRAFCGVIGSLQRREYTVGWAGAGAGLGPGAGGWGLGRGCVQVKRQDLPTSCGCAE